MSWQAESNLAAFDAEIHFRSVVDSGRGHGASSGRPPGGKWVYVTNDTSRVFKHLAMRAVAALIASLVARGGKAAAVQVSIAKNSLGVMVPLSLGSRPSYAVSPASSGFPGSIDPV